MAKKCRKRLREEIQNRTRHVTSIEARRGMKMDLAVLKTELTTDPENLGYSEDDVADATLLNDASQRDGLRELNSRELLAWAGAGGRYAKIFDAAQESSGNTQDVRSVCFVASKLFERTDATLDLRLADRQQMLGALVAVGVLTQADSDSLYAMAATKISRATELGFGSVTPSNCADARRTK